MTATADRNERCYRIGAVDVAVRADLPEALEDFERLYGGTRLPETPTDAIRVAAQRAGADWRGRTRYSILGDGERVFAPRPAGEVFPYLEWGVNWRVVARRSDYIQIHAATLERDGAAVLLVGNSGSGKSTSAAGLLKAGWTYFGDEFALLDPLTLCVHPFPKAICLKHGAFDLARRLGLSVWRRRHYAKEFKGPIGYVDPRQVGRVGERPVPVRTIIFLLRRPQQPAELRPVARAAAAIELARGTFNPASHGRTLMERLCALVRGVRCYLLQSPNLEATVASVARAHQALD